MRTDVTRRRWCSSALRRRAGEPVRARAPGLPLGARSLVPRALRIGGRAATLDELASRHITATLAACGGDEGETARCLGITTGTLQRKLRRLSRAV